jgi:hypothetical protein
LSFNCDEQIRVGLSHTMNMVGHPHDAADHSGLTVGLDAVGRYELGNSAMLSTLPVLTTSWMNRRTRRLLSSAVTADLWVVQRETKLSLMPVGAQT